MTHTPQSDAPNCTGIATTHGLRAGPCGYARDMHPAESEANDG